VIDRGRVVATGTADQLKAKVGGDRLELHAPQGHDPSELARALAGLGSGPATVDAASGRVVLPVDDGPALLAELAKRLAASGLRVADLALRRPTLDDVFLALTGRPGSGTTHADDAVRDPPAEDGHRALASRGAP
jgi:ABC-2 type transport system ATP-binding protein